MYDVSNKTRVVVFLAKHHRTWHQSSYEKRLRNGRGQGEGAEYIPWITVQDFSSYGSASRVKGWKTERVHHFMSKWELRYFYLLEWADNVLDIREQYPLLDVFRTVDIAKRADIRHPTDRKSGFPFVLTSDFFIETTNGFAARTVKMSDELANPRVLEKLEIERRFWNENGIDWRLVTDKEIRIQRASNIAWVHTAMSLDGFQFDSMTRSVFLKELMWQLQETTLPIATICTRFDQSNGVPAGTGLLLAKHLIANKKVHFDLDAPIDLSATRSKPNKPRMRVAV